MGTGRCICAYKILLFVVSASGMLGQSMTVLFLNMFVTELLNYTNMEGNSSSHCRVVQSHLRVVRCGHEQVRCSWCWVCGPRACSCCISSNTGMEESALCVPDLWVLGLLQLWCFKIILGCTTGKTKCLKKTRCVKDDSLLSRKTSRFIQV